MRWELFKSQEASSLHDKASHATSGVTWFGLSRTFTGDNTNLRSRPAGAVFWAKFHIIDPVGLVTVGLNTRRSLCVDYLNVSLLLNYSPHISEKNVVVYLSLKIDSKLRQLFNRLVFLIIVWHYTFSTFPLSMIFLFISHHESFPE